MTKKYFRDVVNTIFDSLEHASGKLNISVRKLITYIDHNRVPAWLMRTLVDKYRINPLYIHGDSAAMFLPQV